MRLNERRIKKFSSFDELIVWLVSSYLYVPSFKSVRDSASFRGPDISDFLWAYMSSYL